MPSPGITHVILNRFNSGLCSFFRGSNHPQRTPEDSRPPHPLENWSRRRGSNFSLRRIDDLDSVRSVLRKASCPMNMTQISRAVGRDIGPYSKILGQLEAKGRNRGRCRWRAMEAGTLLCCNRRFYRIETGWGWRGPNTRKHLWYSDVRAGLAELADAPDSKSGDRKVV